MPAPERPKVHFPSMDARPKYRLEAQMKFQLYKPETIEEIPCFPPLEKQGKAPSSGSGYYGDLREHLAKKQQQTSYEGSSAPSQARSLGAIPKVKE